MHSSEHGCTDNHESCTLTDAVVNNAENRSQDDGTKRQNTRDESSKRFGNIIVRNHEFGSKLEEGEHCAVEKKTEQSDDPETWIRENRT